MADTMIDVPPGLRGVAVTTTGIGDVRGDEGFFHYGPYSAVDLARLRTFEEVAHLLLQGHLPDATELTAFRRELGEARTLPDEVVAALPGIARAGSRFAPLWGLRSALGLVAAADGMAPTWDLSPAGRRRDAVRICAVTPAILAALHRLRSGLDPVPSRPDLPAAADWLAMLGRPDASPEQVRALDQYLVLTMDHGFNASTFTARVVVSSGADVAAAVVAALGAFSGPLHGGAPDRALESLDEIGTPDRARAWVLESVAAGRRIMGFGHAVYRGVDPRAVLLREVAAGLGGELADRAIAVEREVVAALAEAKPGAGLDVNVEYYAGVVMEQCGIPRDMFTPTFATSRVVGWCANILEQAADRRIIRPSARYVGPPAPQPVP